MEPKKWQESYLDQDVQTPSIRRGPQPDNECSWLREIEIGIWLDRVEGICLRAGNLKRRLDEDNERVIRMLSTLEQDGTLLEIRNL